jgi:hypothetical protein
VLGLISLECLLMFLMFVLTFAGSLCCASFIYPIMCWCRCPKIGTNCINWAQLSRFHLKTETESSLRNVVLKKDRTWIMSRNTIFVLLCHCHKLSCLIDKIMFKNCDAKTKCSNYYMQHMGLQKCPIIRCGNPRGK